MSQESLENFQNKSFENENESNFPDFSFSNFFNSSPVNPLNEIDYFHNDASELAKENSSLMQPAWDQPFQMQSFQNNYTIPISEEIPNWQIQIIEKTPKEKKTPELKEKAYEKPNDAPKKLKKVKANKKMSKGSIKDLGLRNNRTNMLTYFRQFIEFMSKEKKTPF